MDFAAFLSNLGNNLGFGLTVTLIGIAIVFLGLTILIGLIKLCLLYTSDAADD